LTPYAGFLFDINKDTGKIPLPGEGTLDPKLKAL